MTIPIPIRHATITAHAQRKSYHLHRFSHLQELRDMQLRIQQPPEGARMVACMPEGHTSLSLACPPPNGYTVLLLLELLLPLVLFLILILSLLLLSTLIPLRTAAYFYC